MGDWKLYCLRGLLVSFKARKHTSTVKLEGVSSEHDTSTKAWLPKMWLWLGTPEIIMYQRSVDPECLAPCYCPLECILWARVYDGNTAQVLSSAHHYRKNSCDPPSHAGPPISREGLTLSGHDIARARGPVGSH